MVVSKLETAVAWIIKHLGPESLAGPPVTQFRPISGRKWTVDFAWPELKVAVEVQGGIWAKRKDPITGKTLGTAHTGRGHERDMEKMNSLQIAGWIVLQFSSSMINKNPNKIAEVISRALVARIEKTKKDHKQREADFVCLHVTE